MATVTWKKGGSGISSDWTSAWQLEIQYEQYAGAIKITSIKGKRTDGYSSYYNNYANYNINSTAVTGQNKILFSNNSWSANWAPSGGFWIYGGSTSITIKIKFNNPGSVSWAGKYIQGTVTTSSQYTISYDANKGTSTPGTQYKTYGQNITLAGAIARNQTTEDLRTIYFDKGDGNALSFTSTTQQIKRNWTFSSWYSSSDEQYYGGGASYGTNADSTMKAQWSNSSSTAQSITVPSGSKSGSESCTVTLNYSANGGSTSNTSKTSSRTVNYSCNGWYTSDGTYRCGNGGSYTPSQAETLHPTYSRSGQSAYSSVSLPTSGSKSTQTDNGTVTLNVTSNGGTGSDSSLSTSRRRTYSWRGWSTNQSSYSAVSNPYTPTGNITLYAHWTETVGAWSAVSLPTNKTKDSVLMKKTVTFNANGGTCSTTSLDSTAYKTYTFKGWYTAASGGSKVNNSYTPSAASTTLYAQWTENVPSNEAYSTLTMPTATRSGYIFKGWNTNQNATTGNSDPTWRPESSCILYAIWQEDQPANTKINIKRVGRTKMTVTCSCTGVVNPTYKILYRKSSESTYTELNLGSNTAGTITGLSPNTKYYVHSRAINSSGTFYSESSDFEKTTLANIPTNLSVDASNVQYTTADITCSGEGDTNADITNYTLYWRKKPTKPIYDMPIKVLSDQSTWVRIFYHQCNEGTTLFSGIDQARNVQTADKYSRLYLLEDDTYRDSSGKFEFMLCYPNDSRQYNRWKQSNSPTLTYMPQNGQGSKVSGYEDVNVSLLTNGWGGLEKSAENPTPANASAYIDGSVGFSNWFYAIGAYRAWQEIGIPASNELEKKNNDSDGGMTSSCVELWVRIDDGQWYSKNLDISTSTTVEGLDDWSQYIFFISATNAGGTNWSPALHLETYKLRAANIQIKNGWSYPDYEKLEYIQSTGVQWIDSGINPKSYNSRIDVEMDMQFTEAPSAWRCVLSAAYGGDDGTWNWNPQYNLGVDNNNKFVIQYPINSTPSGSARSIYSTDVAGTDRHRVSVIMSPKTQSLKIDGFIKYNEQTFTGGPNCNLYVFTRSYEKPDDSHATLKTYAAKMKLYHMTISENGGNVLRDFFPCRRKSDNKVGLYDAITDTFYINKGTGADFTAGPVEIWQKGHLLYKKEQTWKRVEKIYLKQNGEWKLVR